MRTLIFAVVALVFVASSASAGEVATPATGAVATSVSNRPIAIDLKSDKWKGDLDVMTAHRAIRVLVPYSKTLYFVDLGGAQRGLCYDFMRAFEDALNERMARGNLRIHAVFIPVSRARLIPMLLAGEGDVVAANLTITPERLKQVAFTVPLARGVDEIIVTAPSAAGAQSSQGTPNAPSTPRLTTLDDLAGKEIYVQRATSYYDSLVALNQRFKARKLAPMRLREAPANFETEDVLEMANAGLVKIVVADNYLADFWKQVYPRIEPHPDLVLRTDGDIAFAVRKDSPKLKAELDGFAVTHRQGTLFGNVTLQKYLQQTRWAKDAISEAELAKFNRMVALFRKYGERYGVDWLLMAAQGYQESQLDQSRKSAAGAVGVMQVTPATGRDMQVGDIHDLEPNIHAGIKYVRFMVDTYYKNEPIDALNKVLFAFASYNAGPNRIRTLRKEAAARGLNPNVWFDNVERVVAERIGRETTQYVSNIYKYYIAYTLVQEDIARKLRKAGEAGGPGGTAQAPSVRQPSGVACENRPAACPPPS